MPDQLRRFTDPIQQRWTALTRPQQYKLLGVVAVVIIAIALTLFLTFRTTYVYLVTQSNTLEIGQMAAALQDEGIRYRYSRHNTALMVDAGRVDEARGAIILAQAVPNRNNFTWADAFDVTGLSTTESQRRTLAVLASETQIADAILLLDGIALADVILNVPDPNRLFRRDVPEASATVVVTTTRDFAAHEGRHIAQMVANAVQGLDVEQVLVLDQNSRALFNADDDMSQDPIGSVEDFRNRHRNNTERTLNRILQPLLDEVHIGLNLVFEDSMWGEEIREVFEPSVGLEGGIPFQTRDIRAEMESVPAGAEPGVGSNIQATLGYAMGGDNLMSASQREREIFYHVNHIRTIEQTAPGWVDPDRSSVGISATLFRNVYQDIWMRENDIQDDFYWQVHRNENDRPRIINGEFDYLDNLVLLTAMAAGVPIENVHIAISEIINFINSEPRAIDIPLLVMLAVLALLLLMLAYALLRRQRQADEDEEEMEPELSVEDLLVSTQLEEAKEEAVEHLEEIDYFKENEIKKNIEKFVNEKPEAVAALLRNWLNIEEW